MKRAVLAGLIGAVLAVGVTAPGPGAAAGPWLETPMLAPLVAAGTLPPVAERLPAAPRVLDFQALEKTLGRHGGELGTLLGRQKDVRLMVVFGYARLVGYGPNLRLTPDILARVDNDGNRVFTLHLRAGHKWSDGHPFTAEDFRYWWRDVANHPDLTRSGLPPALLVDGAPPRFEVLGPLTVRYSWQAPNPHFLPALAGARPLFPYMPAHYMRQFHRDYADPAALQRGIEQAGKRNWAALHFTMGQQYRVRNPALPTLQPWRLVTEPPADRFVFARNPYYHRVDPAGRQLPYLDRVVLTVASADIIAAKTGAGESDLQARYIRFDNFPFLKQAEERNDNRIRLWRTIKGAHLALFPNLNARDPAWRGLMNDVRFRRALSLAIDRREINQVVYFGLAREGNNTVLDESPLFEERFVTAWAMTDRAKANLLLDRMGLTERNRDGIRLMASGQPLEIIVETAGESDEETDVLELIADHWRTIGVRLLVRTSQRDVFRNRIFSGDAVMSIWSGLTNAAARPDDSPRELAPTEQQQLQWPMWGQYHETRGQLGRRPPDGPVRDLAALNAAWDAAQDDAERERIWRRMLGIHAEQVFTIGLIGGTQQPVVVANGLRNVPEAGVYNWDPGALFGIYMPDTFYWDPPRQP